MKRTIISLVGGALLSTGLSSSALARSAPMYADCVQRGPDTAVLRFYGKRVSAYNYPEKLKLKMLLKQNCYVSQQQLRNIQSIRVLADSRSYRSDVWVETSDFTSHAQYLTRGDQYYAGKKRANFWLPRHGSVGRTQVFIWGDVFLRRVVVQFKPSYRDHHRGPRDRYEGPGHGRDGRVSPPHEPRRPREGRGEGRGEGRKREGKRGNRR